MKHDQHSGGKSASKPLPPHTVPDLPPDSFGKISVPPPFVIGQNKNKNRPPSESRVEQ